MTEKDGKPTAGPRPQVQGNRIIVPGRGGPAGHPKGPPVTPQTAAWMQAQQIALLLLPARRLEPNSVGRAVPLPAELGMALLPIVQHLIGGGAVKLCERPAGAPAAARPDCAAGPQQPVEAMVGAVEKPEDKPAAAGEKAKP